MQKDVRLLATLVVSGVVAMRPVNAAARACPIVHSVATLSAVGLFRAAQGINPGSIGTVKISVVCTLAPGAPVCAALFCMPDCEGGVVQAASIAKGKIIKIRRMAGLPCLNWGPSENGPVHVNTGPRRSPNQADLRFGSVLPHAI